MIPLLPALTLAPGLWPFGHGDNLHTAVPGRLYRSAQLDARGLETEIRKDGIASVLNLRGGESGEGFYDRERAVCARLGVVHANVPMSATRMPTPGEVGSLLDAFDRLPRPILIHCQAGKDRTGLAVTLFDAIFEGMPLDVAKAKGLSHRYGHTGHGKAAAMDRFVDLYRRTSGGQPFRAWIAGSYPALYHEATDAFRGSKDLMP